MTAYGLKPPAPLPSIAIIEAKEKRKKQLLEVWERRKLSYRQFYARLHNRKIQESYT